MDILYLLIPLGAVLVLAILAVFGWAVNADQFEDLEREGERIVADTGAGLDTDQVRGVPAAEESVPTPTRIREGHP